MHDALTDTARKSRTATGQAVTVLCVSATMLLLPAGVIAGIADWLALAGPQTPAIQSSDKWVHGVLFALCGYTVMRAWGFAAGSWLWAVGALTAYGAVTECLQLLIPGRSASVGDLLADVLGACLGVALGAYSNRRRAQALEAGL